MIKALKNVFLHPFNRGQVLKTLNRVLWWKFNQLFLKIPAVVNITGKSKLICYPNSSYGSFVVYAKFPEYEEMGFWKNYLKPRDTVVDVGASIGALSILAAEKSRQGKIYAFEPVPEVFKQLQDNIYLNNYQNRLGAFPWAVTTKNGRVSFNLDPESELSHLSTKKSRGKKRIFIKAVTLDTFVKRQKIKKIDALKIDVEGAELLVLKGAKKLLKAGQIKMIMFELVPHYVQKFDYNSQDLFDYLEKQNYKIHHLTEQNFVAIYDSPPIRRRLAPLLK